MEIFRSTLETKYGTFRVDATSSHIVEITMVTDRQILRENTLSRQGVVQLKEYFAGNRQQFILPLYFGDDFRSQVLKKLFELPFGDVITYKELANSLGSKAYRAVGTSMRLNPYAIVVPCHRVLNTGHKISNHSNSNYFYGSKMKNDLLNFEFDIVHKDDIYEQKNFTKETLVQFSKHYELKTIFPNMQVVDHFFVFRSKFMCLVFQIIEQNISKTLALNIQRNLCRKLGCNFTAVELHKLDRNFLKSISLSEEKINYLYNLCEVTLKNKLWKIIAVLSDEEIYEFLLSIEGVDKLMIQMFLIFGLGRENVISFERIDYLLEIMKREFSHFEELTSLNLWQYYRVCNYE